MASAFRTQKRILFLGTQMALAGAQNVLLSQAVWFHEKGYHVTIAYFYDKQNLESIWRTKYSFQIINLHAWNDLSTGRTNFIRLCIGLGKLYFLIRQNSFDVIESFTPHSNLLGLPVAWLAGIPIRVGSHHGKIENSPFWLSWVHGKMVNSSIVKCLVAVSYQVKDYTLSREHVKENKVKVILNGINLPKYPIRKKSFKMGILNELGLEGKHKLILSVGRLTHQKGHTFLLDSIPYVLEKFSHAVFVIAGDGYLLDELEKKSELLNINFNVHFLGLRDDIADLMNAADIFVLPSIWEGLPIAMLEAMSFGLPVVASQVEGIEDVIENEFSGLVVPPENVQLLAGAINRLLEHPGEAEKMGRIGREHVFSRHTVDQMCASYEDLFLNFLHEV